MKNLEIPVQRDLGEWIDIDYRKNEQKLDKGKEMSSDSDSEAANAPYDTCHAKKGSLTFGALNKQKDFVH